MQLQSISFLIETGVTSGLGILFLVLDGSLATFCLAYFIGSGCALAFIVTMFRKDLPSFSAFDRGIARRLIILGVPFLATSLLIFMMNSTDIIMIKWLVGTAEAGYYSATYKSLHIIMSVMGIFVSVLYPILSEHVKNTERISLLLQRSSAFFLLISFPMVGGGVLLAGPLIQDLLGAPYLPGLWCLRVFLLTIPFALLGHLFNTTLLALGEEKIAMKISSFILALNASLNVVAIFFLGFVGAAIATLFARLVDLTLVLWLCRRKLGLPILNLKGLWQWGVGTLAMMGGIYGVSGYGWHSFIQIGLGGLVFGSVLLLCREPNVLYLMAQGKLKWSHLRKA